MKRHFLVCATGLMAARVLFASPFPDTASWQPTAGPPGGIVYVIASVNSTVFAGTKAGLYKSSDIGATWRVTGFPLKSSVGPITEVQGVLLAGIDNDGLVRSENGGEDWQPSNEGLPNGPFVSVSSLAVIDGEVFAAVDEQLFVSSDSGRSWTPNGPTPAGFTGLYAAGSTLFGISNPITINNPTGGGVYKSNDHGATWVLTEGIPSSELISSLYSSKGFLYATANSGIYRSSDQGAHWARSGLIGESIGSIVSGGPFLFAGSYDGRIFKSEDEGETWVVNSILGSQVNQLAALGAVVYSGTSTGIYRSLDGGDSWKQQNTGLTNTYAYATWALDADVYAAVSEMHFSATPRCALYRSVDFGRYWTAVGSGIPTGVCVSSLASDGSALYAATSGTTVYKSSDRGATWVAVGLGLPAIQSQVIVARSGLIVVALGNRIFRSVDAGASWIGPTAVLADQEVVTSMTFFGDVVFAGTVFQMIKSVDGGASWQSAGRSQFIRLVAASQDAVYAVTPTSGVLKTVDGGAIWTPTGLQQYDIYSLVASGGLLFAATIGTGATEESDVFVSSDGGDTWATLDQGLFVQFGVNLAASTKAIYAGTQGFGVQVLNLFPDRERPQVPARPRHLHVIEGLVPAR